MITSIYFCSREDLSSILLFVKLHSLVTKNACETELCLSLHVTSDEPSEQRCETLRKGEKGRQFKCWISGSCCLILAILFTIWWLSITRGI